MYRAEIFLVTIVILIIFMLLYQAISFRITLKQNLCVTIEYFPLKILLFNFQKKKIKKEKLIKQTKRLLFFLSPLLKSVNFLLRKSEISVYNLSFSQNKSDEPHNYFIYREISALSKIYLYSLLNAISKNTNVATSDFSVPFYSYKFAYPTVTNQSITGGTFDITFREDAELRITKLFQFWVYYMDAIMKNKMKPSRHHIINNYYDFMCSVYEIICDPTSEKILYWAKYTGCFPVSVPVSNLSHNLRSTVDNKVSITFQYIMVESLEPRVIEDFNTNVMKASGVPVPIYDTDFGLVTDTLVGTPFIELTDDQHGLILKWFPKTSGSKAKLSTSIPTLNNINVALNHANNYRAQVLAHRGSLGVDTSYKYTGLGNYLQNNSDSIP